MRNLLTKTAFVLLLLKSFTASAIYGPATHCYSTNNSDNLVYMGAETIAFDDCYKWFFPPGWTPYSPDTICNSNGINVYIGTTSGYVIVRQYHNDGTFDQDSLYVNVTGPTPAHPIPLNWMDFGCVGDTAVFAIDSVAGAASYLWDVGDWTIISGQGTTQATVYFASLGWDQIKVHAQNGSCYSEAWEYITVSAAPPVGPVTLTGDSNVCINVLEYYSARGPQNTQYFWWHFPSGDSSSYPSGYLGSGAFIPDSNSGLVTVSAHNGCGNGDTVSMYVTSHLDVPPSDPGDIQGPLRLCAGNVYQFYLSDTDSYQHFWGEHPEYTVVSGEGTDTAYILVSQYTDFIRVFNHNGSCNSNNYSRIWVNVTESVPVAPVFELLDTTPCEGVNATYQVLAPGYPYAFNHVWSLPAGWSDSLTQFDGRQLQVVPSGTSGYVMVAGENDCGVGAADSVYVAVREVLQEDDLEIIHGSACADPGDSIVLTIPLLQGADEYFWTVPYGWVSSDSLNYNYLIAGNQNGYVSVSIDNDCSNSATPSVYIQVDSCISGIQDKDAEFIVSPNPASDVLNVYSDNCACSAMQLSLFSIEGKMVRSESAASNSGTFNKTIEINGVPSGVYFLQLDRGTAIKRFKVIVQ